MADTAELLKLFDREQRQDAQFYGQRRQVTPHVVRHLSTFASGGGGFISYSSLAGVDVEAVIREQIAFFEQIGQDFEWKVYAHDKPADLRDRLAAQGFTIGEREAVLVIDLQSAPAVYWQPVTQHVRRLAHVQELVDVIAVQAQVWQDPFPGLGDQLAEEMRQDPEHISVFVAYVDRRPVTCAWIRYHPPTQFATLWGGSTLPAYRRQGLYTAILAVRAQEARARGVRFLAVDASPMSQPILEKRGFQLLTYAFACDRRVRPGP